MTHLDVLNFLKRNPSLTLSGIEKESGIPSSTLSRAMSGARKLSGEHLKSLEPVLKKYGYYNQEGARIIAVANHKGGVAKTATTANLGASLVALGKKVLIIDMDQQGNLSQHFGIESPDTQLFHAITFQKQLTKPLEQCIYEIRENFHIVPSDIDLSAATIELPSLQMKGYKRLEQVLAPIKPAYDYILIDCPPSLDILTCSAFVACDSVILAVQPEDSSVKGLKTLFTIFEDMKMLNSKLAIEGILFTMVDRTAIHAAYVKDVREFYQNLRVFDSQIRRNVAVTEAKTSAVDVISYAPKSNGAEDYLSLAKEMISVN